MDAEEALQKVSEVGFRYVEMGLAHYLPHEATDEDTASLGRTLAKNQLGLAALCGTYPVSYPEDELRLKGVEQFKSMARRAGELGCRLMVAELMGDADRFADCSRAFKKSMEDLVPILEEAGLTICFEAHPGDFTDRNKIAVDLIKEVDSDCVKYLYCVPHSFVLGENVGQMIEYSRDVLGYVHLADTLRPERTFFSGRYYPQVPPHQHLTVGKGDIDMDSVFDALSRVGYAGFVSVNPFSMFDDPLKAARESKIRAEGLISGRSDHGSS